MGRAGFTLLELMITVMVIGILASIAIPGFSRWYPGYRLRSAATDLYSHMQLAKMGAVKDNSSWAILFDRGTNSYMVCSGDTDSDWTNGCGGFEERTIHLNDYEYGVGYGHGNASSAIGGGFGDEVTYNPPDNVLVFNSRGTCNAGYVYLQNDRNTTSFGVGTFSSGVVRLLRWTGSHWE